MYRAGRLESPVAPTLDNQLLDASLYANTGFPGQLPGRWGIMVKRQFVRGAQCSIRGAVVLALLALPSISFAQQSGKGFLFRKPVGSFSMRAGYEASAANGDGFDVLRSQTTLGSRSFDAFNLGFDLNYFASRYFDVTMTLDVSSRSNTSEYRDWEENGKPIVHESELDRVALGAGFRYNLLSRGRQISSLAYIPARTVPYIGATAGVMWYDFTQNGDFVEVVNDSTGNIFSDELRSSHYGAMGQVFGGIERRLNAHWSLVGEGRFTQSNSKFTKDYMDLGDLKLSGLALTLGASVRF